MAITQQTALETGSRLFKDIFNKNARIAGMPRGYIRSLSISFNGDAMNIKTDYKTAEGAPLDKFLDEGTRGHFIFPVKGIALKWTENGKDFFSKGHFIRGIKPRMVMERTTREFNQQIEPAIRGLA